jgi:hypothetical protein
MILDFQSDITGAPKEFPPAGIPVLVEDGGLQPLNPYFVDLATGQLLPPPLNIEIWAQSDFGHPVPALSKTWGQVKSIYR